MMTDEDPEDGLRKDPKYISNFQRMLYELSDEQVLSKVIEGYRTWFNEDPDSRDDWCYLTRAVEKVTLNIAGGCEELLVKTIKLAVKTLVAEKGVNRILGDEDRGYHHVLSPVVTCPDCLLYSDEILEGILLAKPDLSAVVDDKGNNVIQSYLRFADEDEGSRNKIMLLIKHGAKIPDKMPTWAFHFAKGFENCKRAVLTLHAIYRFRKGTLLHILNRDVIRTIAEMVWNTRDDPDVWNYLRKLWYGQRMSDRSTKRVKYN